MRRALLSWRVWVHLLVLRPLLRLVFGVSVEGRENLAGLERFVLAANHNSHLDVLLLFGVLPVERIPATRPVAAEDYFRRRRVLFRVVDALLRPIWVVRGERTGAAVETMARTLESGGSIIIFPEGTRGEPGTIGRFRTGVARLAERHRDVPTIPVFLHGPERALPRDSTVPLPIWNRVIIGPARTFGPECPDVARALESMVRELSESETAGRHRRIERPRRCLVLAVLGIDGSGKSTVSRGVAEALSARERVCRVSDRLEFYEGGVCRTVRSLPSEQVRQALGRYAKAAGTLKRYKIPKLAELLLRDHLLAELRRWHRPDVAVTDGSPVINLTAWARLYREELFDPRVSAAVLRALTGGEAGPETAGLGELAALRRLRLARLSLPDAVVMLDVDPAEAVRRIRARGEPLQVHETEEKLSRLREAYHMVCEVLRDEFALPVGILDGSLEPESSTSSVLGLIEAARARRVTDGSRRD
jgi:1-acyl-sn-glycerol-3-phosphate acyltransferase